MYKVKINYSKKGDKLFIFCPKCSNKINLSHDQFTALLCPQCKAELYIDTEEFELWDIPIVIFSDAENGELTSLLPNTAKDFLKSELYEEDDYDFVETSILKCSLQNIVDLLVQHPSFQKCLEQSYKTNLIKHFKNQPEN